MHCARAARAASQRFRNRAPGYLDRARGRSRMRAADRVAGRSSTAATIVSLSLGCARTGSRGAVAGARERYGPHRVAVLIGTSTSGIHETELAYRRRDPATGALPPGYSIAAPRTCIPSPNRPPLSESQRARDSNFPTACSSSAKVFASAHRLLEAGFADAAVVGGVDSLCLTTLYGVRVARAPVARAVPALRRGARRYLDRRGGRLRAAGATGQATSAVSSWIRGELGRDTTCPRRTRRAPGCATR
jgi:hypothetical protein